MHGHDDNPLPPYPVAAESDDLFGKLDHLLNRQEAVITQQGTLGEVPTLTEAIEPASTPRPADTPEDVPVLLDAVERTQPERLFTTNPLDQLRHLQAALYLRLRQGIDAALQDEAVAALDEAQRNHVAHALRRALPRIVRQSVEQVFGSSKPKRKQ
ncbi:MAG: hypothetical protein KIS79_12090 [Burkholderiales bacterium]|nr:hypothetical protein [Burkholderiales bacterium]